MLPLLLAAESSRTPEPDRLSRSNGEPEIEPAGPEPPERPPEVEPAPPAAPPAPDAPEIEPTPVPETPPAVPQRPAEPPPEIEPEPGVPPPPEPEITPGEEPGLTEPPPTELPPLQEPGIPPFQHTTSGGAAVASRLADVPPEPPAPEPRKRAAWKRWLLALLVIGTAAVLGYLLSRPPADAERNPDALVRSVAAASRVPVSIETDQAEEASRFIRDEFGWRVATPTFEVARLVGVGIAEVAPAVEVPVLLYKNDAGAEVAIFAYSYALLDQVPDRLQLTRSDYDRLATEGAFAVRRVGRTSVLLWRQRDDIYVAVTEVPPEQLAETLQMGP